MDEVNQWREQIRQLVKIAAQGRNSTGNLLDDELLEDVARGLEELESSVASLKETELQQTLTDLQAGHAEWRKKAEAAQEVGLSSIEARITALQAEQSDLQEQNLPYIQKVVADFREKGQTAVTRQQTITQTIAQHEQRLAALAQEKTALEEQEKRLNEQLAKWRQQERLRQLRQACLQTAEALQTLRHTLHQQVEAGTRP